MSEEQTQQLAAILKTYAVPDKSVVGKLPRGGTSLDFVGHADVTKMLIEIDPLWAWEPAQWQDGRPAINIVNGNATMWGTMTLLGKSLIGVGSADSKKADLDKELVSDFIRNAAMRFGVCLSLWTKSEWEHDHAPAKPVDPDPVVSLENIQRFKQVCVEAGLDWAAVSVDAGVHLGGTVRESGKAKLLASFKKLKAANLLDTATNIAVSQIPAGEIPTLSHVTGIVDVLTVNTTEELIAVLTDTTPPEPVAAANALASTKQIAAIRALLRGGGVLATQAQLEAVGNGIGRVVESLSEITGMEAAHLISTIGKGA